MEYVALQPFEHGRTYRKGDMMGAELSSATLAELEKRGLIAAKPEPKPKPEPEPAKRKK